MKPTVSGMEKHPGTAALRARAKLRVLANTPFFVRLRFLKWKNALLWRRLCGQGEQVLAEPVDRTGARRRILAYCPEAQVRDHLVTLQILGRALAKAGHQVLFSHCRGIFQRCVPKDSLPGDAPRVEGEKVCINCIRSDVELSNLAELEGFSLSKAISPQILDQARSMVDALPDSELSRFTLDGAKLGLACWHELMLSRKLMFDTPLSAEDFLYLRQYLHTVIATYLGAKAFLPRAGITDVLLYGQYVTNIAMICAAEKTGVNWRVIVNINHLGVDRRRVYINRAQSHLWISRMLGDWARWRTVPLAADMIAETGDDVMTRFGAKSYTTYSPAKTHESDIFSTLKLDRSKRIVAAFTSSLDEYHAEDIIDEVLGFPDAATPERPYPDQIAWLKALSNEIGARSDLQLVIRIHPREDANKREGARSRHLELLRQNLSDLPSNVKVVWPADPVSSYDLIEAADVVQVWASTIGLESARLGIPVLKILRGYESYPEGEFAISAPTHQGVIAALDDALNRAPDLERLVKAWRFYGYSRFAASIDLRDALPAQYTSLPAYREPRFIRELEQAVLDDKPVWAVNQDSAEFAAGRLPPGEEAVAIKRQLRRIIHTIFTGEWPAADIPLVLHPGPQLAQDAPSGAFAAAGNRCSYAWAGRIHTRTSPMCARLAVLAHEPVCALTVA